MAFTKLDDALVQILCCPICKSRCDQQANALVCPNCQSRYEPLAVSNGHDHETVYDFRIHRPHYCRPVGTARWTKIQGRYEAYHQKNVLRDDLAFYQEQIESVRDLYTHQFHISGHVLDVGGHQGRLRHFLNERDVPLYVSTDPFPNAFDGLCDQPNLLAAYPCLTQPCNFVAAHAESLPFVHGVFDWVHMRSVLDHFEDPFVALKEAHRVLRPGGRCLIGLTVERTQDETNHNPVVSSATATRPHRSPTAPALLRAVARRLRRPVQVHSRHQDEHMTIWRYKDVINVLQQCRFTVLKEYWQRPTVIYVMAAKEPCSIESSAPQN